MAAHDFDAGHIRQQLAAGCAEFNLPVEQHFFVDQCVAFLSELARWNTAYNLTAVRDPVAMVGRHILDALTVLPWMQGSHIADVGTGAGVPGIPLALCLPDTAFTLLDSNGKKIRFVTHAKGALGLANVTPVQARLEAWVPEPQCSTIVCRAFTSLAAFIAGAERALMPRGRLIAMKGQRPDEEIDVLPDHWQLSECTPVEVPGVDEERHVLVMERKDAA